MAIKCVIHEYCFGCGEKVAKLDGQWVWEHSCKKCPQPPGPASPPRRLLLKNVQFIAGDLRDIRI